MKDKIQIHLLLFAQLVIIACLDMADPYWPLIVRHLEPSSSASFQASWTTLIYMAPYAITIFSAPIWAYVGKHLGYKKMVVRASFVLATTQICLFLTHNLDAILFLRIFQGAFAGFTAAAQAWLICTTNKENHGYYIGKVQAVIAVGSILGPILGGFISHYISYGAIFVLSSGLCLSASLILSYFLNETNRQTFQSIKKYNWSILKNILSNNLFFLGLITCMQTVKWMSASFFALYVIHQISGDNITVGILYALIAGMIIIFSSYFGKLVDELRDNTNKLKLILLVCLILSASSQLLYAEASGLYLAIISSCIWGACQGITSTIPFSLLIKNSPPVNKGVIIGAGTSASKLGNLLGIAIGGYIYAASGMDVAFVAIAVGYMLTFVFVLIGFRSVYESIIN
jgi:MFS transporter, DHA1 family, staphyloferrin B biosynthesis exporter